jgi:hypothetical protein
MEWVVTDEDPDPEFTEAWLRWTRQVDQVLDTFSIYTGGTDGSEADAQVEGARQG